jgi:hypothetical protein
MGVVKADELAKTYDCKTPGCTGEARSKTGRHAYCLACRVNRGTALPDGTPIEAVSKALSRRRKTKQLAGTFEAVHSSCSRWRAHSTSLPAMQSSARRSGRERHLGVRTGPVVVSPRDEQQQITTVDEWLDWAGRCAARSRGRQAVFLTAFLTM